MNSFLDFGTACRREAREQHDRRGLEARRRVREDVGGRACSVKMARDASSVDARHWRRETMHREDSEEQFQASEHASFCSRLIPSASSLWLVRPHSCQACANAKFEWFVRYRVYFFSNVRLDQPFLAALDSSAMEAS